MSKILFDEQPIVIDRTLAKLIGLNEAIVIQQVHYWISVNKAARKNLHDGRFWTFNSISNWHEENFPFWSLDTVKRTFAKLETMGLLVTGNYNKEKRDRTKWYSINYELLDQIAEDPQCNSAKCTNGENTPLGQNALMQNAPMQEGNMPQPLPEITSENEEEEEEKIGAPSGATSSPFLTLSQKLKISEKMIKKILEEIPAIQTEDPEVLRIVLTKFRNRLDNSRLVTPIEWLKKALENTDLMV